MGVNVAVWVDELYATVPVTGVTPGPRKVKVAAEIVEAVIASLNVAVMLVTSLAPLAGVVKVTVGATVSLGPTGLLDDLHPVIATSNPASDKAVK